MSSDEFEGDLRTTYVSAIGSVVEPHDDDLVLGVIRQNTTSSSAPLTETAQRSHRPANCSTSSKRSRKPPSPTAFQTQHAPPGPPYPVGSGTSGSSKDPALGSVSRASATASTTAKMSGSSVSKKTTRSVTADCSRRGCVGAHRRTGASYTSCRNKSSLRISLLLSTTSKGVRRRDPCRARSPRVQSQPQLRQTRPLTVLGALFVAHQPVRWLCRRT